MIGIVTLLWPKGNPQEKKYNLGIACACPFCELGKFTGDDRMTINVHGQVAFCRNCGMHSLDDTLSAAFLAWKVMNQSAT